MSLDLALTNNSNWEKVFTADQSVVYDGNPYTGYKPIPSMFAVVDKHTLLIGASSATALPHWYLAARVTQYIYTFATETPTIAAGIKTSSTHRIKLGNMSLVQLQNFNFTPFLIMIEIPYWIKDVHVEVWKYLGLEQFEPSTKSKNGSFDGGNF